MEYQVITPEGVEYLKSVTAPDRVFYGDEIEYDYAHDEMPDFGIHAPGCTGGSSEHRGSVQSDALCLRALYSGNSTGSRNPVCPVVLCRFTEASCSVRKK